MLFAVWVAALPWLVIGTCHTDADCSYLGTCTSNVCSCRSGFRGVNCAQFANETIPVDSGFRLKDYDVWGSQVVYSDGMYHMFASVYRLPGFDWLHKAQIAHATAKEAVGPYILKGMSLPYHKNCTPAPCWDQSAMNPKIVRHTDGTWLIYYTGDDAGPEAQGHQRIGLAHSRSLDGPWTRLPTPILYPREGKWDDRMVTNPSVVILPNGTVYMIYKASTPPAPAKQTGVCMGIVTAPHWMGPYTRLRDDPVIPCPKGSFNFEDPCVWYDPKPLGSTTGVYHLIVKDFHGKETHHGYSGAHLTSLDGIDYTFTNPALAYTTTATWSDGKTRKMKRQERAQVLINSNGDVTHVFYATDTGLNGSTSPPFWNMVWPLQ